MSQLNLKRISAHEKACRKGTPLRLLSICSTNQPCDQPIDPSYAQKESRKSLQAVNTNSTNASPNNKHEHNLTYKDSDEESVSLETYCIKSRQPKVNMATSHDLGAEEVKPIVLEVAQDSQTTPSRSSSPQKPTENKELERPLIKTPTLTPLSRNKLVATCISSANRSPFKGTAGAITQSPTIQLGRKVFHIPGSILLGEPTSLSKRAKKPTRARTRKKKAPIEPESECDLTLVETSDPYAFVLKKRGTKDTPQVASAYQGNILTDDEIETSSTKKNQGDALFQPNPHLNQSEIPLLPESQCKQGVTSFSPPKPSYDASVEPMPLDSSTKSTKANLPMSDLSFTALFDESSPLEASCLDEAQAPKVSTEPCYEPPNPFSLLTAAHDSKPDTPLLGAMEEPTFDIQAFLEQDLGIFAQLNGL